VASFSPAAYGAQDAVIATTTRSALALALWKDAVARGFLLVQHDEGLYHADRTHADDAMSGSLRKIVVSSWLAEVVARYDRRPALMLLNPIDRAQFHEVPGLRTPGEVRVLMLHHTSNWKGTAEGVALVERLKRKYPGVKLVLFGVRSADIEYPSAEYHYDLPQDKLHELYSSCDIYLCPSWDEGSGLPSMEAMAGGAALVTYDNGGSRDYAIPDTTAFVAKRRDTEDLYAKLELAASDAARRERIAAAGRKHINAMPTWEEQAERFEAFIAAPS